MFSMAIFSQPDLWLENSCKSGFKFYSFVFHHVTTILHTYAKYGIDDALHIVKHNGGDAKTMEAIMAKYNGHKNYNHWNVSLWINNDEGLYLLAKDCCKRANRKDAARRMLQCLNDMSISKTPDGAPYTISSIMGAMSGM